MTSVLMKMPLATPYSVRYNLFVRVFNEFSLISWDFGGIDCCLK